MELYVATSSNTGPEKTFKKDEGDSPRYEHGDVMPSLVLITEVSQASCPQEEGKNASIVLTGYFSYSRHKNNTFF